MFFTACSTEDGASVVTDPIPVDEPIPVDDPVPVDDPIPADDPVPTVGITGIWEGTLARRDVVGTDPETYDFAMLFYMPDGETRGQSNGAAFRTFPNDDVSAHFLLTGGYQEVDFDTTNDFGDLICGGEGWAVGRLGANATFLREYSYETGGQAGPDQRGAMCLNLAENKLTGELRTEHYGEFLVDLTYSLENLRDSGVADLASAGSDAELYNRWSNDNTGTSMSYSLVTPAADSLDIAVVEDSLAGTDAECGSPVRITDISGHNLYIVETQDPHVTGCNYIVQDGYSNVDRSYAGLGTLIDKDGTDVFVQLMSSYGAIVQDPAELSIDAQVLFNEFTQ